MTIILGNATLTGIPSFQLDLQAIMNADKSLYPAALPSALASCTTADILQARHHGVPVHPWTWTGLPGWRLSASFWDSWSTSLWSLSVSALDVPSTRLSTVGDRAFPVAAARTWNSLPAEMTPLNSRNSLQTFRTQLKSYLFLASFP